MLFYINHQPNSQSLTLIQNEEQQTLYSIAGRIGRSQDTLYLYDAYNHRLATLTQLDKQGLFVLKGTTQEIKIHLYGKHYEHFITIPQQHDWGISHEKNQIGKLWHYQHLLFSVKLVDPNTPQVYQLETEALDPTFFLIVILMFTTQPIAKSLPIHYPWREPNPDFVRYYRNR